MENDGESTELIKKVLASQRFAVLATQSKGQPYSNLIAFAEVDNMRSLVFVAGRDTRKYANTQLSKNVAILIDNRTNDASDLRTAVAITAIGVVGEVFGSNRDVLSEIYLSKHPQLADFLHSSSNALMEVAVAGYVVATFEGVAYVSMDGN